MCIIFLFTLVALFLFFKHCFFVFFYLCFFPLNFSNPDPFHFRIWILLQIFPRALSPPPSGPPPPLRIRRKILKYLVQSVKKSKSFQLTTWEIRFLSSFREWSYCMNVLVHRLVTHTLTVFFCLISSKITGTVCPRSSDPFYIVTYYN